MELSGVMHITDQIEACTDFYRALLGVEPDLGAGWAQFRVADGRMLALHTPWDQSLTTTGGSSVTLIEVASLAAEGARLAGSGIVLSEPHDIPGGAVVTVTDPDGRLVQLMERHAS